MPSASIRLRASIRRKCFWNCNGDRVVISRKCWWNDEVLMPAADGKTRNNRVRFHDKMTLKSDGVLINDAWVSKYGFPVACTHVEFRK